MRTIKRKLTRGGFHISEWTQRDQSILDTIELLLRKEYGDDDKSR